MLEMSVRSYLETTTVMHQSQLDNNCFASVNCKCYIYVFVYING